MLLVRSGCVAHARVQTGIGAIWTNGFVRLIALPSGVVEVNVVVGLSSVRSRLTLSGGRYCCCKVIQQRRELSSSLSGNPRVGTGQPSGCGICFPHQRCDAAESEQDIIDAMAQSTAKVRPMAVTDATSAVQKPPDQRYASGEFSRRRPRRFQVIGGSVRPDRPSTV